MRPTLQIHMTLVLALAAVAVAGLGIDTGGPLVADMHLIEDALSR